MINLRELYEKKQDCCGCELCAEVCPFGVLTMKPDVDGFLYPAISSIDKCVDCKRCVKVCPMKSTCVQPKRLIKGYGGHAIDETDVRRSSSGGLSAVLGRCFINKGGVVYGVRYSEDFHSSRYSKAEAVEELDLFRTSKYFQARKGNIYEQVKYDLNHSINVLFVGLSCEIAALYNYLGRDYDNLFTVSLICHGVTSPLAHDQFCSNIERNANSIIDSLSLRHKINGWKPYYIKGSFANKSEYLKPFVSTDYEMAFKYLKRPSCSHCRYKLLNKEFGLKADLLIGDYHSQKQSDPFYNRWGASLFYVCSKKGELLLLDLSDFYFSEVKIAGKEWTSPAISIPTKKLLFHNLYARRYRKYGLKKASETFLIRFAYKIIQPRIKEFHLAIRMIQIRLFHKVYIW